MAKDEDDSDRRRSQESVRDSSSSFPFILSAFLLRLAGRAAD